MKRLEKTTKLLLPVQFTDEELQAIGLQLAAAHQKIGKLTIEKKIANDRFKEDIEAAENEAARLADNRISGPCASTRARSSPRDR
ncbi:MAG TPA: hypothetical protein VNL91_09135 [Thermoanaerobaculia bacterium]|nr:hypothetical protein [Thermoanaerobaculia bacterium]